MSTAFLKSICILATGAAFAAFAEDEAPAADDAAKTEESAEAADGAEVEQKNEGPHKYFRLLPMCRVMEGPSEVLRLGAKEWAPLEEGRFYPLGSTFRTTTPDSRLTIQFGGECEVEIKGISSFGTRAQPIAEKSRSIRLIGGFVEVRLPRNLPTGLFSVTAPGFTVVNPAGESNYEYKTGGDGEDAIVRCVTGTMSVEGRHFKVPAMRAANAFRIRTSQDMLFTGLYGHSGDIDISLDQGQTLVRDFENGVDKVEARSLTWKLSPKTVVRIHRAVPKIGERMSVTTMTFDSKGELINRCAFAEGRPEINTGEQGEIAKARKEELAKKAAEAAEQAKKEEAAKSEAAEATESDAE